MIQGVESDAAKSFEAYPPEDVEMDLAGTVIPDDEFHEEPQLEESKVLEEVPNAGRWQSCPFAKIWCVPVKNCWVVLCGLVEPMELRSELRVNSSVMFAWRTDLRKVTCLQF